jgi:hypothetical protein
MAVQRDRPYGNANFVVDLGDGAEGYATGFAEVVFPVFGVTQPARHEGDGSVPAHGAPAGAAERLILKRGVSVRSISMRGGTRPAPARHRSAARCRYICWPTTTPPWFSAGAFAMRAR